MDEDMTSPSSSGGPPTPESSTPSPSPLLPSIHTPDCPIAIGARIHCTHERGSCTDCQLREHGLAAVCGMLERVCMCAQHNPTPRLETPAGQQRCHDLISAGARDLLALESAREHVAWLGQQMGEAVGRVVQARMAGGRPRGDDIWVINEAGAFLNRVVPRMVGAEGSFSLDTCPVPVRHLVLPSSPLWDGWAGDADAVAAAAAARKNMEEYTSPVVELLDARKQALQQQRRARPLVVNGSTPYPAQTTAQASTSASTPYAPDHQQSTIIYQYYQPSAQFLPQPAVVNRPTTYRAQMVTTQASAYMLYPPEHQQSTTGHQYYQHLVLIPQQPAVVNRPTQFSAQMTAQQASAYMLYPPEHQQSTMDHLDLVPGPHIFQPKSPFSSHVDRPPSSVSAGITPGLERSQPLTRSPSTSPPPSESADSSTDDISDNISRPADMRAADHGALDLSNWSPSNIFSTTTAHPTSN